MFQNSRWPSFSRVVTQCNVWLQPVRHLGAIVLSVTSLNGSTHDWALAGAPCAGGVGTAFITECRHYLLLYLLLLGSGLMDQHQQSQTTCALSNI